MPLTAMPIGWHFGLVAFRSVLFWKLKIGWHWLAFGLLYFRESSGASALPQLGPRGQDPGAYTVGGLRRRA